MMMKKKNDNIMCKEKMWSLILHYNGKNDDGNGHKTDKTILWFMMMIMEEKYKKNHTLLGIRQRSSIYYHCEYPARDVFVYWQRKEKNRSDLIWTRKKKLCMKNYMKKIYTTIEKNCRTDKKNQHKKNIESQLMKMKQFMGKRTKIYFQRKIIMFKRSLLFS